MRRSCVLNWWRLKRVNEQEEKIVRLLLNEMAFEGAMKHFGEAPPEIDRQLFDELEAIGIPERYDGNIENYRYFEFEYNDDKSVFENCYFHLRIIRNNIIHANKAFRPDPPERLNDLLDWARKLIDSVYETDSEFGDRAREIKAVLNIESF